MHEAFLSLFLLRLDFIYDLFEKVGSRNNEEKMGTARRKPTVSSQFRVRHFTSAELAVLLNLSYLLLY